MKLILYIIISIAVSFFWHMAICERKREDDIDYAPQGNRYLPVTSFQVDDVVIVRIKNFVGWYWTDTRACGQQYGDFVELSSGEDAPITNAVLDEVYATLLQQADETKDKVFDNFIKTDENPIKDNDTQTN